MDTLDVYRFARTGAVRAGAIPLTRLPRLGASLVAAHGELHFNCQGFIDALGRPGLELSISASLVLQCDRCGGTLALALAVRRNFYFVATDAQLAAIAIDDAPEEALLGSEQFDLRSLIEDEAILQLPLSPRHADCRPAHIASAGATGARAPSSPGHPFAALAALRPGTADAPGPPQEAHDPRPVRRRRS